MLEHLAKPTLLILPFPGIVSDNVIGTDNQQGSLRDPSETTRRTPSDNEIRAYFQGAIHDGTYNHYNRRSRISQKGTEWLIILRKLLSKIGFSSWIYREGKERDVYVLETKASFLDFRFDPFRLKTNPEKKAYVRGFFDAEGGIPRVSTARFYIQLVQNDRHKMEKIKKILLDLGVESGVVHNPSVHVDPDYWRIFVRAHSWKTFIRAIGSWHPRKYQILCERWKMI